MEKGYGFCACFFNKIGMGKVIMIFLRVLGVGVGVFALIFGEADDSPGLQGIGLLLVLTVFFSLFKIARRN